MSETAATSVSGNTNLALAKRNRKDEWYTQLTDIEKELRHYKKHFEGKIVYGNADDPRVSNFFRYFSMNFEALGLKKLITTSFQSASPDLFSQNDSKQALVLEYEGDKNGNRVPDPEEVEIRTLKGDGSFDSAECLELLDEADIVCTNPPFSKFKTYLPLLITKQKKFLVIGNMAAVTYKEIFPHIKANQMWYGHSIHSGDREFGVPDDYPLNAAGSRIDADGRKFIRVKGVRWFTNLDYPERHEDLILFRTYTPEAYPKYVNFDAIDIARYADVPADYDGIMGVPTTLLDFFNPDQFEILANGDDKDSLAEIGVSTLGREFIDAYRARGGTGHYSPGMRSLGLMEPTPRIAYKRILIRKKK